MCIPLGNPHYWLDPENGKRIARQIADKLSELRPNDRAYFDSAGRLSTRLDAAEKRWLALDGALQRHEDRDLPPIVAQFRRTVRPEHHRLRRTAARHSADAEHTLDLIDEMKRQNVKLIAGRALLRPEDAQRDRPRRPAPRCS